MKTKLMLFIVSVLALSLSAKAQQGEQFAHNADHTILVDIQTEPFGAVISSVPESTNDTALTVGKTPYTALVDLTWKRGWFSKKWGRLSVWTPGDICKAMYDGKSKHYDLYLHFALSAPGYKSQEFGELIASFDKPADLDFEKIDFIPSKKTLHVALEPEPGTVAAAAAAASEPAVTNTVMIAGAQGEVGEFGTVHVAANVDGASVDVDGKPAGMAPIKLIMRAGSHEIVVNKAGYAPYTKTMDIKAQREVVLKVTMTEAK